MDKTTNKIEYVSPSMKTVEFEFEGSILIGSGGMVVRPGDWDDSGEDLGGDAE